ncbi:hypothetical protein L3Q82_007480 [Scortum barcoo]|uniref:Uncharacterized protein n=1 Tax=Scortum barcoo TaxID=214431 RepID=A0ACB8WNV9_9TELE|nr:hypothetical protein L3Q82_007480 [Scortum barcoo]
MLSAEILVVSSPQVILSQVWWCSGGFVQHMRPYYLPREFTHALVVVVYVPPSANADAACDVLLSAVSRLQTQHPDALLLISGDFNHASPSSSLPKFTQQPAVTRTVKKWSEEAEEALKDCFNTTLWDVFSATCPWGGHRQSHPLPDGLHINFCVENTVPTRTVRSFSNSKPWITPDIKALLKEKRRAFVSGNKEELKPVQRELRRMIRKGKDCYRRKMEHQLQQNNICGVWKGLKTISGFKEPKSQPVGDQGSHSVLRPSPPSTPPCSSLLLTTHQVRNALKKNRARKAAGPDGISSRLLKSCADQLCGIFGYTFNLSLKLGRVPQLWKTSCIVPVPKTPHPKELNSYRPVALTSHLMKTLERLVLAHLRPLVSSFMDPLQFTYQPDIGVDDAVIYLLHTSLTHLEKAGSTVRIMFFDFSSAFNTIQPRLLGDKLQLAGVDHHLTTWILDYLTHRPQFVRVQGFESDRLLCSTGAPAGERFWLLSCSPSTLQTFHTTHHHVISRSSLMTLLLLASSQMGTTESTEDLFRTLRTVSIQGTDIDTVKSYKYLGVHLNDSLDWSDNTNVLVKKGNSRLFLLRRLRSFGVQGPLLRTFYDSVVASAIFYGIVCWASSITDRDRRRMDRLVRRASSVLGCPLDSVEVVGNEEDDG